MLNVGPLVCWTLMVGCAEDPPARNAAAEARAVAFLTFEIPRWSRENHCYSCHNNGDAARALYQASRAGIAVPPESLTETTRWLVRPANWQHNGGEGPFSDKRLARVVFSTTLATAVTTGWIHDRAVLVRAAELLALDQADDGSWPLEGEDATGSPATYGRPLATLLARDFLLSADSRQFRTAIDRASDWLSSQDISTINDASVCLMVGTTLSQSTSRDRAKRSLELMRRGQSNDGGWGPRVSSAPEPFDTALALLALAKCDPSAEIREMIAGGKRFLITQQQQDGSWIETTRPAGNISYAQRISTTGWVILALLATREPSVRTLPDSKR